MDNFEASGYLKRIRQEYGHMMSHMEQKALSAAAAMLDISDWTRAEGPCSFVPATDDPVLVCTLTKKGIKTIKVGYYTPSTGWVVGMNNHVIAWMELPDPPDFDPEEV